MLRSITAGVRNGATREHSRLTAAAGIAAGVAAAVASRPLSLASSRASPSKVSVAGKAPSLNFPQPLYTSELSDPIRFEGNKFISTPKTVAVLGAPMVLGQPRLGVDKGPTVIRAGGLHDRLKADHWRVEDVGDVKFDACEEEGRRIAAKAANQEESSMEDSPIALHSLAVGAANYRIYKAALERAKEGKLVLTLGGDHSIAIGSIAAQLKVRPDTTILWVDAHADINTPTASGSKNIHGMVLSFLMNLDDTRSTIPGFEWLTTENVPVLQPHRVAYIGLRDVDWAEKQIIKNLGIRAFTMQDVDHLGIAAVMERAIDHITRRVPRPIHLTFDIDSIDPMFAPSTGTRVSGGLTYREAYYICEWAAETNRLASMDLVEVNPAINETGQEQTVRMAVGLCASALGNKIL